MPPRLIEGYEAALGWVIGRDSFRGVPRKALQRPTPHGGNLHARDGCEYGCLRTDLGRKSHEVVERYIKDFPLAR